MRIVRPVTITDAMIVSSDVAEDDFAAYSGGSTYAIGEHVISTSTHRVYESLQSGNMGNALPVPPQTDTAWWLDVGATNRWRMFDGGISVQSENEDAITVILEPGRVDSVALLNIDAQSYQVTLSSGIDSPDELVYDSGVVALGLEQNIADWYQYFFEPTSVRRTEAVLTDIPQYGSGRLTVTLLAPTAIVKLGELIVGQYRLLGEMQWRPRIGIIDYSIKETDQFGNITVTERAYSKRLTADVFINNALIDEVIRVLSTYRATAVVWIGSEEFTSTIVYGYYRSFDAVIDTPAGSFFNLEIEGLT